MLTKLHLSGTLFCVLSAFLSAAAARELPIGSGERLLVVAPHPDDESLGAGGLIQRVLQRGGRAHVIFITAGDGYREAVLHGDRAADAPARFVAYGDRRLHEARRAVAVLGHGHVRTDMMGFPDGGIASLLGDHWRPTTPARSPFTQADRPPYAQAFDPRLPYAGIALRDALASRLGAIQPTIIALPDWMDTHPDHGATGLFVLLAVEEWIRQQPRPTDATPRLLAYLIHWGNWPPPPGQWKGPDFPTPEGTTSLHLPPDLPPRHLPWRVLTLTDAEIRNKSRALAQHESQRTVDPYLLGVFVRRTEPFIVITAHELPRLRQAIPQFQRSDAPRG